MYISELLKLGDLQESYNKWSIAIENSIKTVKKKQEQKIQEKISKSYKKFTKD